MSPEPATEDKRSGPFAPGIAPAYDCCGRPAGPLGCLAVETGTAESAASAERRSVDRRVSRKFVVRERRTGFDRRGPRRAGRIWATLDASLVYLRDNASVVLAVLLTANLLSILDLVFTLRALQNGAQEGNPVMKALLDWNPAVAGGVKVGIILGLSLLIWRLRRYRMILQVALFALAMYGGIIAYHIYCLIYLA
jgi:hypothetical protein